METNELYRTSDIYVTSWLLSNGLQLEGIDRSNSKRCVFVFHDRADRPKLVNEFQCGSATGNVVDLIFYMKRAKRLLYSVEV
ncbi:hypothetical protein ES703_82212 [subsurface metagenome]